MERLKAAGLNAVNISLDTLVPAKFELLTRRKVRAPPLARPASRGTLAGGMQSLGRNAHHSRRCARTPPSCPKPSHAMLRSPTRAPEPRRCDGVPQASASAAGDCRALARNAASAAAETLGDEAERARVG